MYSFDAFYAQRIACYSPLLDFGTGREVEDCGYVEGVEGFDACGGNLGGGGGAVEDRVLGVGEEERAEVVDAVNGDEGWGGEGGHGSRVKGAKVDVGESRFEIDFSAREPSTFLHVTELPQGLTFVKVTELHNHSIAIEQSNRLTS